MNCVEFFRQKGFALIWALRYTLCDLKKDVNGRQYHSFMYLESGEYRITYAGGDLHAAAGDLLFFPKGSVHRTELLSESAACIQVEFEISGHELSCAPHPFRLRPIKEAPVLLDTIVSRYEQNEPAAFLEVLGCLYHLAAAAWDQLEQSAAKNSRIRPAVEYIEKHLGEPINIDMLANLCTMSASQLRRLFRKEYRLTPVAYKNNLRMDRAKFMLYYGYANISEISVALGFDNVYAFSNMFKKHTGISPSEYLKKKERISLPSGQTEN